MRKIIIAFMAVHFILLQTELQAQTLSNLTVLQKGRYETETKSSRLPKGFAGYFIAPQFAPGQGKTDTQPTEELGNWQYVARYVRDNPTEVASLLEMNTKFGNLVTISRESKENKMRVLAYTLLALQPQADIDNYFTENRITDAAIKTAVQKEIDAIKSDVARLKSPTITLFATGNIRSIATEKSPDPTSGTGSLGAAYASDKHILSVQFTVASTLDTNKSAFGSFLLAPLNGKSLRSASAEYYRKIKGQSYVHVYGNLASSLWEIQKDSIYKNASTAGLGVLYHYRLFEGQVAETDIGLGGEIGLAARWLNGDIRNMLKEENTKAKYLAAFPTEKNYFLGLEAGLTLNFGQVIGAMQAYYFFKGKDPVDGLTGLQLSVGLSVRGDMIRGFLNSKD